MKKNNMNKPMNEPKERFTDKMLPVTFDGHNQCSDWTLALYNVIFTEDFGPFKKDQAVRCLDVNYENGTVQMYDESGETILFECNVRLTVVP